MEYLRLLCEKVSYRKYRTQHLKNTHLSRRGQLTDTVTVSHQ